VDINMEEQEVEKDIKQEGFAVEVIAV